MENAVPTYAPLAFSLSVGSEEAIAAMAGNAVDPVKLRLYPLSGTAAVALSTHLILGFVGLPGLLTLPVAACAGFLSYKRIKAYFAVTYVQKRLSGNQRVISKVIDRSDVRLFADEAAASLKSHYGTPLSSVQNEGGQTGKHWVNHALSLKDNDPYLFLANVFTYAPELWRLSAQRVYANLLNGVVPAGPQC